MEFSTFMVSRTVSLILGRHEVDFLSFAMSGRAGKIQVGKIEGKSGNFTQMCGGFGVSLE